jgi:uncharacterized membrane protein
MRARLQSRIALFALQLGIIGFFLLIEYRTAVANATAPQFGRALITGLLCACVATLAIAVAGEQLGVWRPAGRKVPRAPQARPVNLLRKRLPPRFWLRVLVWGRRSHRD